MITFRWRWTTGINKHDATIRFGFIAPGWLSCLQRPISIAWNCGGAFTASRHLHLLIVSGRTRCAAHSFAYGWDKYDHLQSWQH
jgi:hypothetical protein